MRPKKRLHSILTFLISFNILLASPGFSQEAGAPKPETQEKAAPGEIQIQEADGPLKTIPMTKRNFGVVMGRSHLMRFADPFKRVSVSDPEVLDFLVLGPSEILLNARKEGAVNLIVWNSRNEISVFDIGVTRDPALLEDVLKQVDPNGKFDVFPSNEVFVVRGQASTVAKAKEIEKAANAFAEGSVSLVEVKDSKQILLQIRFVQIDRSQDFDFGLDVELDNPTSRSVVLQRFLPGATNAQTVDSLDDSSATLTSGNSDIGVTFPLWERNDQDIHTLSIFQSNKVFLSTLKALEAKGIVKTIARPNLLAKDGEEASFLVGGEAAIVTSTEDSVNVQYKEFGTRLKFTPEILGNGKIKLIIEPEISSLNQANGVTVGSTEVPGFTTTRVKSVVELKENESFIVGGLIQQKLTSTETGFPGLRRLPIFGKLFESTDYEWDDIELLILVTPVIVMPESPIPAKSVEHDILSKATSFSKFPVADEQGEAIEKYLIDNQRFLNALEEHKGSAVEIKPNAVKNQTPKPDLDSLEAALKWKKPGEAL